jgi:hypothetical protein
MSLVPQYRVLLLDPVKLRRDRVEQMLRLRFETQGFGTITQALAALKGAPPPHAIVGTLRQIDDNGLVAGKALRAEVGKDVYILVHGAADTRKTAAERQAIADRHGVDTWSEIALEPDGIASVLGGELHRRHRPRTATVTPLGLMDRARSVTKEDVKAFLTKDRPLIPTPIRAPDEPPGWIELLNAPPTAANLKALLTKEIGVRRKSSG